MKLRPALVALGLTFTPAAQAVPQVGRALPAVSVRDLNETVHTNHDLQGQWTIALTMTDKDTGPALTRWFEQLHGRVPAGVRIINFVAVDLFPLVPTSTILSQARERTPRASWDTVWLSRDGSFANQLGLPESETPWVFVIDPAGRVVESIHAEVDAAGAARVIAAVAAH